MSSCPSVGELQKLLAGALAGDVDQRVGAHVETCAPCQRLLEELTDVRASPPTTFAAPSGERSALGAASKGETKPPERGSKGSGSQGPKLSDDQLHRLRHLLPPDSSTAISRSLSPGQQTDWPTIPGYEILRQLGQGGMAVVYEARHLRLNRRVALKVVRAGDQAAPERMVRFCAEGEIVAGLRHPNIVQIYEVGTHNKQPYFALELMEGGSLAAALEGKPLPAPAAAALVETLARAMDYAHAQGIVHRDLNPSNILLQMDGKLPKESPEKLRHELAQSAIPKISDFGLAKHHDQDSRLTRTGFVMGTPSYMAPEQVRGRNDQVGPPSDGYALGAILYELLTGRPPFQAPTSLEVMNQVTDLDPVPPSRLLPQVPRDLEVICLKCLEKDPARRYAGCRALADDLRRYLDGEPIQARRIHTLERAWRWAGRRPAVAGLLLGLVLVALAGVGGILWQWQDALRERRRAETNERGAHDAEARATRSLDLAEDRLYFSRLAQARLEWRLNYDVASAEALLDLCAPAAGTAERRGWEWHYLKGLCRAERFTCEGHSGGYVEAVAFSPDGRLLASAGGGNPFWGTQGPASIRPGEVLLRDAQTGALRSTLRGHDNVVTHVTFSSDGRWLATCADDGKAQLWDMDRRRQGQEQTPRCLPGTGIRAVAFHPDGIRLATVGSDHRIQLWDVGSAQICQTLKGEIDPCTCLAFNPDGRLLAGGGSAARPSPQFKVWDLAAGRVLHDLSGPSVNVSGFAFSPDSRQLLSVGSDARLWDLGDGRLIRVLAGHKGAVLGCAFAPDGTTAATAGADRTVRLWDVRDGAEKIVFRGHRGRVSCVCFSPDGRALASADQQPGEVKVWDPTRSPEFLRLGAPEHRTPEAVAFTADGTHVLSATPDGRLKVFNLATLQVDKHAIDLTAKWHAPAALAAFDGFGRRLAAVTAADLCRVRVWDLQAPGGKVAERAELIGHTLGVYQVAVSSDGRRVATGALGETKGRRLREVRVWDADTGKTLLALTTPAAQPKGLYGGLALSPDGDCVAIDAAVDDGKPPRVKVLETATGKELVDLIGPGAPIGNLAFSTDGRLLAAADTSGRILLWDWAAHRLLHAEPLQGPWFRLAFSPDGKCLAGADRDQVKLWDMASGQEVLLLRGAPPRSMDGGFNPQLAWSADGRRLAAVNWDATITVWDAGPGAGK